MYQYDKAYAFVSLFSHPLATLKKESMACDKTTDAVVLTSATPRMSKGFHLRTSGEGVM